MSETATVEERVKKDAAIEAICRQLCDVDGYDPDMFFFREELLPLRLPGGRAFAAPDERQMRPAWTAYIPYAIMIFERKAT